MSSADADALARRCVEVMWDSDRASRQLGMRITDVRAGRAVVALTVGDSMVNGHRICHGGYIATLGDSAFAFACNSYDDVTVASGFDITFVAPAYFGDELYAVAEERSRTGRNGIYDITVWRAVSSSDERIAEMRGRSRSLGRRILG